MDRMVLVVAPDLLQNGNASMPETAARPPGRFQFWLRVLFALLTTGTVTFSLLAWMLPSLGEGNIFNMFFLLLASWIVFSAILGVAFGRTTSSLVLIICGTFVALFVSFQVMIGVTRARLWANPLPRPMFHNLFAQHDRVLLPFWQLDGPLLDYSKNAMYADFDDNVLLLVLQSETGNRVQDLSIGPAVTRIEFGGFSSSHEVEIPRTTNALLVVRPDGNVIRLALPPNAARQFYDQLQSNSYASLILETRKLLGAEFRPEFDSFVTDVNFEAESR